MNSLVQAYLRSNPDDDRDEELLTWELGQRLREKGYDFDELPDDFKDQYLDIERSFRPGKIEEFKQGFGRGVDTLQGTLYGAVGLAGDMIGDNAVGNTIRDFGVSGYQRNMEDAQRDHAPSVRSYKDVESFGDALQYGAGLMGEAAPSLLESIGTGLIGAAAGSATAPGAGTIGGAIAGFGSKSAIRGILRKQLGSRLAKEMGEGLIEDAMKASSKKEIFKKFAKNLAGAGIEEADDLAMGAAKKAAAASAGARAVIADSMIQNAGATYGDLSQEEVGRLDRITNSLLGGSLSGALDAALPATVIGRLFGSRPAAAGLMDGVQAKVFGSPGSVRNFFTTALRDVGIEGTTEALQELVQEVSVQRGIHGGDIGAAIASIDPEELRERMINAGLAGMAGGGLIGVPSATITTVNARTGQKEQKKVGEDTEPDPEVEEEARKNLTESWTFTLLPEEQEQERGEVEPEALEEEAVEQPEPVEIEEAEEAGPEPDPEPEPEPEAKPEPELPAQDRVLPEQEQETESDPEQEQEQEPEPEFEPGIPPTINPPSQEKEIVFSSDRETEPEIDDPTGEDEAEVSEQEAPEDDYPTDLREAVLAAYDKKDYNSDELSEWSTDDLIENAEENEVVVPFERNPNMRDDGRGTNLLEIKKATPKELRNVLKGASSYGVDEERSNRLFAESGVPLKADSYDQNGKPIDTFPGEESVRKIFKEALAQDKFFESKYAKRLENAVGQEESKKYLDVMRRVLKKKRASATVTRGGLVLRSPDGRVYGLGFNAHTKSTKKKDGGRSKVRGFYVVPPDPRSNAKTQEFARIVEDEDGNESLKINENFEGWEILGGLQFPKAREGHRYIWDNEDLFQAGSPYLVDPKNMGEGKVETRPIHRDFNTVDDTRKAPESLIYAEGDDDMGTAISSVDPLELSTRVVNQIDQDYDDADPEGDSLDEIVSFQLEEDGELFETMYSFAFNAGLIDPKLPIIKKREKVTEFIIDTWKESDGTPEGFQARLSQVSTNARISEQDGGDNQASGRESGGREGQTEFDLESENASIQVPKVGRPLFEEERDGDEPGNPPMEAPSSPEAIDRELARSKLHQDEATWDHSKRLTTRFQEGFNTVASDQSLQLVSSVLGHLERANPEAFSTLSIVVDETPPETFTNVTPEDGAAFNEEDNTIWISPAMKDEGEVVSSLLHETGHFASRFLVDSGELFMAWSGLTDKQRKQAFRQYFQREATDEEMGAMKDLRIFQGAQTEAENNASVAVKEWTAMAFHRVALDLAKNGELSNETQRELSEDWGLPGNILDRLVDFARELVDSFRYFLGDDEVTSDQLESSFRRIFDGTEGTTDADTRFPLSGENVAALDSLKTLLRPKNPTFERKLMAGMSSMSGMANPKVGLQYARTAWGQVEQASLSAWKSITGKLAEKGIGVEYDGEQFSRFWNQPGRMVAHINTRADEEGVQLDEMDYDRLPEREKRIVALIASQEIQYIQHEFQKETKRVNDNIAAIEERLSEALEEDRRDARDNMSISQLKRRLEEWKRKRTFLNEAGRALYQQASIYAGDLGATHKNNIGRGALIPVPRDRYDKEPEMREFQWDDNGELVFGEREVVILRRMREWMDVPENKARNPFEWNQMKSWYTQVGKMAQQKVASQGQNLIFGWTRPIAQELRESGHPAAADAGRQTWVFQGLMDNNRNRGERLGRKSDRARWKLIESLGLRKRYPMWMAAFTDLIDTPAKDYLEQHGADLDGMVNHLYSRSTPIREMLDENPNATNDLKDYLRKEMDSTRFFREVTEETSSVTDSRIRMPDITHPDYDPDNPWAITKSIERPPVDLGEGTFMRTPNIDYLRIFVDRMRIQNGNEDPRIPFTQDLDLGVLDPENEETFDYEGFLYKLGEIMNDEEIQRRFLMPLVYKPKVPVFVDEAGNPLSPVEVQDAWEAHKTGAYTTDIISFFRKITQDSPTALAANMGELRKLLREAIMVVDEHDKKSHQIRGGTPHIAIDARTRDRMPSEWLKYRQFGKTANQHLMANIAFHSAFGKDGAMWDDRIQAAKLYWGKVFSEFERVSKLEHIERLRGQQRRSAMLEAVDPKYRQIMETAFQGKFAPWARGKYGQVADPTIYAKEKQQQLDRIDAQFKATFASELGPTREAGAFMQLIQLLAQGALNGPRSAFVQFNSIYFPVLFYGRNGVTGSQIWDSGKNTVQTIFGSFLNSIGIEMKMSEETLKYRSRHVRIFGETPDKGLGPVQLHQELRADMGPNGSMADQRFKRGARYVSGMLSHGVNRTPENKTAYFPSFNPFAPFRTAISGITDGAILSTWKTFDTLAVRAIDYIDKTKNLPASDKRSPFHQDFRFTPEMLGYKTKLAGLIDERHAFHAMTGFLKEHVGTSLEEVALSAIQTGRQEPFTDLQYGQLAQVALGHITSESTQFGTRPAWMKNTGLGRIVSPLLGWTMQQPNNFSMMFKDPATHQATYKTIANGMLTFATMALPFTVAFSLFMDWFDEGVLGKKSAMRKLTLNSGMGNNAMAMAERFARWGPMGLPAEAANSLMNIGGTGGDVRDLSLDQRILFANSVRGVLGSIGAWINQGKLIPEYASVVRPMMMSLGMNGPLQMTQMVSNMTGLDNIETRVNRRTNSNNWLRSSGRILGLEVRTFGGSFTPTQMTPHVTRMVLNAMANDRDGFRNAYRKALKAASDMGKMDPEKAVRMSYASRHPLKSVFKSPPTQEEYNDLLDVMRTAMPGSNGEKDVQEAIRLFNAFGESLGINPYHGREMRSPEIIPELDSPFSIGIESGGAFNPYTM